MRTSLVTAVVVVAVALGVGLGVTACGGSDEDDPLARATELADTWLRGWNDGDPDTVASVFTENGQYTSFAGFTDVGRAEIARHVPQLRSSLGNLVRVGDVSETDDGTFTWTVDFSLGGGQVRGMPEMELEGDLISRLWWAQDPEPIG